MSSQQVPRFGARRERMPSGRFRAGITTSSPRKWQLTSVGRMTRRICSMEFRSGLSPPCIVKIFSSMIAAMGRQLKQSVNVFHSLML